MSLSGHPRYPPAPMHRTVGTVSPRLGLVAGLFLALALSQCSTPQRPPVAPAEPQPAEVAQDAPPAIDLADRPRPPGSLLSVRIGPPRALATRLGAHLGLGDLLGELLTDALPGMVQDDEPVARAINLDAPVDALLAPRALRIGMTLALGTGDLSRVRAVISDGHSLDAYGAPSLGAWRVARNAEGVPRSTTFLAAAAAPPGGGRWVLSERPPADPEGFSAVLGYLTRTVARHPFDEAQGALQAEVHMDTVHTTLVDDIRRDADREFARASTNFAPPAAGSEDGGLAWLRSWFAAFPTTVAEVTSLRGAVHLPDTGARVEATAEMGAPSALPVQQLLEATAGSTPPVALLQRLPPGGMLYGATALSLAPLRTTLNVLPDVAVRLLLPRSRLTAPDRAALMTALTALAAQDSLAVAAAAGRDPAGSRWRVAHFQVTTPAAQFVSNVRALVTQLKRLPVARAIQADQQYDMAQVQVLPGAGLPPGSLYLRVASPPPGALRELLGGAPAPAAATTPARPGAPRMAAGPTARVAPLEIVLAPEGPRVWWVVGADARARLRAAMADHPSPIAVEGLVGAETEGVRAVGAVMPAIGPEIVRDDPRMARVLSEALTRAGADAQTPGIVRVGVQQEGEVRRLRVSLDVPRRVLSLVARSFQQQ